MSNTFSISTLLSGGSFIIACGTFVKLVEKRMLRNSKQSDNAINTILLYGAEDTEEVKQVGLSNIRSIHNAILQASRTIDVCVPSLSSDTLAKCLIESHQKNKVKIRIFIHNSEDYHNLTLFAQNGIEVKIVNPDIRLGHEFTLIDVTESCGVAVLGSLDHDTSSPNCNRDATILTSDDALRAALHREFERVWNSMPNATREKDDQMIM